MELNSLIIPTGIARPGMTVGEVFHECVRADVPGIPFQGADGRITGKASIRNILKETCIPNFMVRHAHLLGDESRHLSITDDYIKEFLDYRIEPFIVPETDVINSATSISKALAIMERANSTYLFVIDHDQYLGVVSIMGYARAMLMKDKS
jgi:hypothetical protein